MVNYNKRNYVCLVHNNATFQKFCITCKKNCCSNCNEHINHIVKNFKDILVPTEEETFKEYNDLRKNINKLAERIQAIINKLNDFIHSIEVYFKISKEISEGFYSTNMKNYQLITNFLQFRNQNKILKEEINDIMDNLNAVEQFKKIMILDSSLNEFANKYNYITGEIFVNEENRNNYIRIINSYEERKRNSNMNYNKDNSQFLNEKEIKESCKIFIDDKAISFAYFYKFNKTGMHNIKYYFTNNLTRLNDLFSNCIYITNLDFTNYNSANLISMNSMFYGCKSLKNINFNSFNTSNVLDMGYLFSGCQMLNQINLSNFNTEKVIDMSNMFSGCIYLTELDLSKFNTQNVVDMSWMFYNCSKLNYLNLSNFNKNNILYYFTMFNGLRRNQNINIKTDNNSKIDGIVDYYFKKRINK